MTPSPPQSPVPESPEVRSKPVTKAKSTTASVSAVEATFAIEELSDLDPDDCDEGLDVLRPSEVEYPPSDCSRPHSRHVPDMDPAVMSDFKNLNPFDDSDDDDLGGDDDDGQTDDFLRHLLEKRRERRLRRMKSGSISKRTVSERGSDSDKEDILPWHDGPEAGPNSRRLRRKTDRHSMQFSGQFPERIEELKEPNSDDDEIILDDAEILAKELPYWTYMEVDSE